MNVNAAISDKVCDEIVTIMGDEIRDVTTGYGGLTHRGKILLAHKLKILVAAIKFEIAQDKEEQQ